MLAIACAFPAVADLHRYEMQAPLLQIYPANMRLTLLQQHAALYTLAREMKLRGGEDLAGFVRIALYEMAALYDGEARRSGASDAGKSIAWRWTDTTMTHANHLYRTADAITTNTVIDITNDGTGELLIIIDGKPFLLNSPVLDDPLLLDERIIARTCLEISCDGMVAAIERQANKREIVIDADWIMSMDKPPEYVTSNGLHFVFADIDNRSAKQIACLKLIKEIELLAGALRDAVTRGVTIDRDQLAIQSLYGSYDYRVRLNLFGDTIHIKLPELHHVQNWTTQLLPWLRASMDGQSSELYLQADVILAYALK